MDDDEIERERERRRVDRVQRQHEASQEREQRHQAALEEQDETKQGQRVWIVPEFDAGVAEAEHLIESVRTALPAYNCQLAHAPEVSERDLYELMNANTPTDDRSE